MATEAPSKISLEARLKMLFQGLSIGANSSAHESVGTLIEHAAQIIGPLLRNVPRERLCIALSQFQTDDGVMGQICRIFEGLFRASIPDVEHGVWTLVDEWQVFTLGQRPFVMPDHVDRESFFGVVRPLL